MTRLSRRELLTALLGASVAEVACRSRPVEPTFGGELLGQDLERGHRIRDGLKVPPSRTERVEVLVLGGGAAGLSAAWRLGKRGVASMAVLELEDAVGGTARWGHNEVASFPWGAHYVPVPMKESVDLVELLTEAGAVEGTDAHGHPVIAEEQLCREPQERLFFAGQWHEGLFPRFGMGPEESAQFARFQKEVGRLVALRDGEGRRAFALPSPMSGRLPEVDALDGLSMAQWMDAHGFDSPRLRWWVEYACKDDYGASLSDTSAWAGLFYFSARIEEPGVRSQEFVTWPEGNGHLIRHLEQRTAPFLRRGVAVLDVQPRDDGVTVLAWDVAKNEGIRFEAEHAVLALPTHLWRHVVSPWRAAPPPWLARFSSSSWVTAQLTLRDRPRERGFPLAWDNVVHGSKSLGYVVATHQAGIDRGPTVLTWYLPLLDGTPAEQRRFLQETSWRHWVDVVLSDLRRAHPDLPGLVQRMDVWRWGHAMVRPTPGLLRSGVLEQAREGLGRMRVAHTDLSGIALFEEAQHWGTRAAEAILAARGGSRNESPRP